MSGWFGAVEKMMPYMSMADRLVYMRLIAVIRDLVRHFEQKFGSELCEELKTGRGLGMVRVADSFAAVWGDLHLEQGTNRHWMMMLQFTAARRNAMFAQLAALPEQIKTMEVVDAWCTLIQEAKPKRKPRRPKQPWVKRSPRHGTNVKRLSTYLEDVANPFPLADAVGLLPDEVTHLTSGAVPPKKVSKSLLHVEENGIVRWNAWCTRREAFDPATAPSKDNPNVFSAMKKSGLVNFTRGSKLTKRSTSDGKENKMLASYTLKLISANEGLAEPIQIWDINRSDCLARCELSRASHMLFKDGAYRKGTKALLMNSVCPNPPRHSHTAGHDWSSWACILDYAALLQKAPRSGCHGMRNGWWTW